MKSFKKFVESKYKKPQDIEVGDLLDGIDAPYKVIKVDKDHFVTIDASGAELVHEKKGGPLSLYEDIFIGHKLKLQELQKYVRDWSDRIWGVNKQLKDHAGTGEFGQFCRDYPEYVTLYWYCGGRKLQPSKRECEDLIKKAYDIPSIDALSTNEKWDLLNKGLRPGD